MTPTITDNIFSAPPVLVAGRLWYLVAQKAAAIVIAAGVLLVTGCSGVSFGEEGPLPEPPPTLIVLMDVSASTVQARSAYLEQFKLDTRKLALQEGSTLHVIFSAGDPLAESRPMSITFSTEEEDPDFANADLVNQANIVIGQVSKLMESPPLEIRDSTALLRSFVLAGRVVGKANGPLNVVVYSDGVENSYDMSISNDLDDAAIATSLDRLQDERLIPAEELRDVPIYFPLVGYHPGGSQVDERKVEDFWDAWAARTGAKVSYG